MKAQRPLVTVVVLLALDDTDTPHEGCTTYTAHQVAEAIHHADGPLRDWDLLAPARLVRLNPAAEHKTRGNGALVLPIGPTNPDTGRIRIGTWSDGRPLEIPQWPPDRVSPVSEPEPVPGSVRQAITRIIQDRLPPPGPGQRDPQPAALLFEQSPASRFYQLAVAQTIQPEAARCFMPPGTHRLTPPRRRGETGALAAAAWPADTPSAKEESRWTWEAVGYRQHETRSTSLTMDRFLRIPGGFDNLDPTTGRLRAVPRTPCPVAFAVRSRDPHGLRSLLNTTPSSPPGWVLLTNQATGDHARYATATLAPHKTVVTHVDVTENGRRTRGGHLFVEARRRSPSGAPGEQIILAAYEPTKTLRDALEATAPGDRLTVLARIRDNPRVLALEAFRVDALAPRTRPGPNPRCGACGKATKSRGRGAGFRCPRCHRHFAEEDRTRVPVDPAPLRPGARFQVPDHVRGHLLPPHEGLGPSHGLTGGASRRIAPSLVRDLEEVANGPAQVPVSIRETI